MSLLYNIAILLAYIGQYSDMSSPEQVKACNAKLKNCASILSFIKGSLGIEIAKTVDLTLEALSLQF